MFDDLRGPSENVVCLHGVPILYASCGIRVCHSEKEELPKGLWHTVLISDVVSDCPVSGCVQNSNFGHENVASQILLKICVGTNCFHCT